MYLYHIYICIYIYMYILYVDSTVYIVLHFDHQASYHFHFSPFRPHNAKAKRPKTSTCHSKSLVALPHDESCMADFQELRCLGCKKQNTKKNNNNDTNNFNNNNSSNNNTNNNQQPTTNSKNNNNKVMLRMSMAKNGWRRKKMGARKHCKLHGSSFQHIVQRSKVS